MTIIEQIKAEIERRIALYSSLSENTVNPNRIDEDRQILSFLSTLEPEKPMNQERLEEELDNWRHKHFHGKRDDHFSGEYLERTSQLDLARHFAQWGEEHLSDASKTSLNNLEEAARKYQEGVPVDTRIYYCGADEDVYFANRIVDAVIAGAKWQKEQDRLEIANIKAKLWQDGFNDCKEQMMKEAVEHEVGMHGEPIKITFDKYVQRARGIFPGDKVRIIIVKED